MEAKLSSTIEECLEVITGVQLRIDTISDGVVEGLVGGRLSIGHEDKYSHTVGQRNHLQGGR